MRIDNTPVKQNTGLRQIQSGEHSVKLEEGQLLEAKILSNDNGNALLKTQDGAILRATLDDGVSLTPGSEASFIVADGGDGVILLKLNPDVHGSYAYEAARPVPVRETLLTDKSLAPFAEKLLQLNLPLTAETVNLMRELVEAYPQMPLDTAATLAANNISEKALVEAGSNLLEGEKISDLIIGLSELVSGGDIDSGATHFDINGGTTATGWAGFVKYSLSVQEESGTQAQGTVNAQISETGDGQAAKVTTIPQSAEDSQTSEASRTAGASQGTEASQTAGASQGTETSRTAGVSQTTETSRTAGVSQATEPALVSETSQVSGVYAGEEAPELREEGGGMTATLPESTEAAVLGGVSSGTAESGTGGVRMILSLLSRMPAFEGIPERNLKRLSELIVSAAKDLGPEADHSQRLKAALEKLFVNLDSGEPEAGARLKKAKEELFIKLSLISDEVSRSGLSGRAGVVEQTQKLAEHARLIENINQFYYAQLPVSINGENRTAEMYIYKNKRRKIDPEDVNILVALDLEYLGHIESLINIRGKDVSLNVEVQNEAAESTFKENTIKLHKMLTEIGYRFAGAEFKRYKEATTIKTAMLHLQEHERSRSAGFDISV